MTYKLSIFMELLVTRELNTAIVLEVALPFKYITVDELTIATMNYLITVV